MLEEFFNFKGSKWKYVDPGDEARQPCKFVQDNEGSYRDSVTDAAQTLQTKSIEESLSAWASKNLSGPQKFSKLIDLIQDAQFLGLGATVTAYETQRDELKRTVRQIVDIAI
jgi:hypothetical protein